MGFLHIYCGDGKGKTTAAIGLAIRAAGADMKVNFVQLMKGSATSELSSLKLIPNIKVSRCDRDFGFFRNMSAEDKAEITECHNNLIKKTVSDNTDIIIFDEFCSAYNYGLLNKKEVMEVVLRKLKTTEIILTGRDPDKCLLGAADYISEIKCIRHPYEEGLAARKGIEY